MLITAQVLFWLRIVFITLGVILFAALVSALSILWWHNRTKNNPNEAVFLVDFGTETIPIKGYATKIKNTDGVVYVYANEKITIPNDYGFNYVKHRRKIEVTSGNELIYPHQKSHLSQNEYHELETTLMFSSIGKDIVNAVCSLKKQTTTWVIIAIIAFAVGVLGTIVFTNYQSQQQTKQLSQQSNQKVDTEIINVGE